ncbi:unnamed protein product [Acanthoscelides obtectus]|uniref:MADF domain-containing protein n=1 Tax=Acanthoscelides obtectus TaxID=200917 RepID=A0A9P0PI60_ACAOB|nr:unnamed protein product [Acanthoscelides obtectus]CAH2011210.1 unnamed protein product [Acanthoscelides obtectus]CAK1679719.1 hypothetical protein AOBTE_LOCUS32419 [Acanthoscelides obtectus]CAK1679741.1 hypothetical protein AOBTE_LOCUS32425 [Acanthoscelides obtectus]
MKWGDDQMVKLVYLYKIHPCLWRRDLPEYKDKTARELALKSIVAQLNIPNFSYIDCKEKIKNVRSHYCQELKKVKNSMRNNSSAVYKPTLAWFHDLDSYLRNYITQKPSVDEMLHIHLPSFKDEVQEEEPTISSPPVLSPPSPAISVSLDRPSSPESNVHSAATPVKSKRKRQVEHAEGKCYRCKKTEFDIFGESVAAQLSTMSFVDALQLQLKIQELITRERLISFQQDPLP